VDIHLGDREPDRFDDSESDATVPEELVTERTIERQLEDDEYTPVIIKRTDETRRHPDDTLENAIQEGMEQLDRPTLSLALSSVAAGLIVGFSAMVVAVVQTAMLELQASELLTRLATAFVYPLGFVICVMSGAQLFTEHTATALYPVLDRRSTVGKLLRLWFIVIVGNIVGAACGAFLHSLAADVVNAKQGYIAIGHHLVGYPAGNIVASAVLAGWLMALGAWLVVSSPRTGPQMTFIYTVTFLIGACGLHHSIAGSAEMFSALLASDEFTLSQASTFIGLALSGNLIGGACFVAILNYAHIRRTRTVDSRETHSR
jgi:formate/nitrite transporter FocA (FNT family)